MRRARGPDPGAPAARAAHRHVRQARTEALAVGLRSGGVSRVVCHVDGVPSDLRAVDALARPVMTARRAEVPLDLRGHDDELLSLLRLVGLTGLLDGRVPHRG